MRVYQAIVSVDLKNVRRDPLLPWAAAVPLFVALVLRAGVPPLADWLRASAGLDPDRYHALLMSFLVMIAPSMVGMVIGFLLLDERDEQILAALQATPLSLRTYLSYRVGAPLILGLAITLIAYPVAGLAPVHVPDLLAAALLAAFNGPITALFLAGFAENKVSGLALVKVLNSLNVLPVVAYFVEMPWQLAAGVIPAYWPMKALWSAAAGQGYLHIAVAGFGVNVTALLLLARRLNRKRLR